MTQTVKIIGIGNNGKESLPQTLIRWIEESEVLLGGERQLSYFPAYNGEKVAIRGGLKSIVERLQHESRDAVVLASGDPLFYGIGSYLSKKVKVEVYPYLSSVQLAFAKMGESWQDAYFTSVHGRSLNGLVQRIDGKPKIAILTDKENTPGKIASYLLSFGVTEYKAFVAENLEGEDEKCGWFELSELTDREFSPLNVVILKKRSPGPVWPLGIDDEEFFQRKPDKGLITKKEIRILSISALRLKKDSVVWDIGTCTGSVAIEAAKIATDGEVYAIEKNEADIENCLKNQRKFRTDFTVINQKAPEGLEQFPDPDAVFIGGTGGEIKELIHTCCSRLKKGGRIVLNAATIENLYIAKETFHEAGYETEISLVQVSRSKPILQMTRFVPLNPVYIITAYRKEGEEE
ncbi:bifunctional cobalt-precorrin-7 (C(5))-methyltransferase/cobalt-precorrin-6B (C(15))-methyltransferase [Fictibacillus sp. Mic-4]|uniref:bifunctional cobalt-precorrin-7 (C(5))-methyltransferase/cobalt-precorrin-6B (C(15))-methyltransferase n=1 Tax=Fictibacillus TaxID=1329200 RepID=UPI000425F266|nr:bifunctional cobalt-precorrin-7 (C(5))-methyltransferase/cobalt-precorrin-6B (C(15))-methyltransferase [Fictibacillus gelatini]